MKTRRYIYWFLNAILAACALGTFSFGLYFHDLSLFMGVWIFALFIYLAAFIMESLRVNIADLILWLADRFRHRETIEEL